MLPTVQNPKRKRERHAVRRLLVHLLRVALFVSILLLIRYAHRKTEFADSKLSSNPLAIEFVSGAIPGATRIGPYVESLRGNLITDAKGKKLGCVLQTSPESDSIIGYSGPTNCLIALDLKNKIQSVKILNSGDTIDHVESVRSADSFWNSFKGLDFDTTTKWQEIDGVSGATLTSYSAIASVANRMSGSAPSLKFNAKPNIKNVKRLIKSADSLQATDRRSLYDVLSSAGTKVGSILTTTPAANQISGYQGPTVTLAGFDNDGKCVGLIVDQSYENTPYARYLDDDYGFQAFYQGKTLAELAEMNPESEGIEGVSGATMTSVAVAEGIPLAAQAALAAPIPAKSKITRSLKSYWADGLTILLTLFGLAFSFTKLSRLRTVRIAFQILVIVLLGFINGHLLSQASLAGWSANSIPWAVAPGIVFLSFAALLIPICSKHQTYCQHICPFGAIQQLTGNRIQKRMGWKLKIPPSLVKVLECIPYALLLLVVLVAVSRSTFNLASIEPFDGFAFRVAGWATISIFVIGLLLSLFSPMAYCRFGCPTGAVLGFLRFRADAHRLGRRDIAAATLLGAALLILWLPSDDDLQKPSPRETETNQVEPGQSNPAPDRLLVFPENTKGRPAAGKRVAVTAPEYFGTEVHHMLYLPEDWDADWKTNNKSWPVIVEYTGNHFPTSGSTGKVEDAHLGYGVSGGKFIWVTLPFVDEDESENEIWWWGNTQATVKYARQNLPRICKEFGGDADKVILCGFSRGAIAASYIGLHDNEVAKLWAGILTHDHFDGLQEWKNTEWGSPLDKYQTAARIRLDRLGDRPMLVCDGFGTDKYAAYFEDKVATDNIQLLSVNVESIFEKFPNQHCQHPHTDAWLVKDSPARQAVWKWVRKVVEDKQANNRESK